MNMIDAPVTYPYPPIEGTTPESSADLGRLLRRFRRGLPVICVLFLVGLAAGCLLLRTLTPGYTSTLSILIDPKTPGSYGADTEFANVFVDASKIASIEVVLLSSNVLQQVVAAEHLADQPAFGDAHRSMLDRILAGPPPSNSALARQTRAIGRLRRMIKTNRVGTTYVIDVDVAAETALQAQRLAAALADAYLDNLEKTRQDAIRQDSQWLADRLAEQRGHLLQSDAAVEALRKQYHLVGGENGLDSSTDRQSISRINDALTKAQGDVAAAQAAYEQAEDILRTGGDIEGMPDIVGSKVIQDLRGKQADASRRVADLSMQYTNNYPPLQHALEDRRTIDRQVALEVRRVLGSLKYEYNTAAAHRDSLAKQLNRLVGLVNQGDNAGGRVELREAERVAEANRIAYEATLKRLHEVQPQQSRQEIEARVISGPDLPERPSSPKPAVITLGGGIMGLLAGLGLVMVLPSSRERIGDGSGGERDLLLPILSSTPYLSRRLLSAGDRTLSIPDYVAANPFSSFAEGLNRLRLRLRSLPRRAGQIVQVTSAISREGKSTIAASLAVSAASSGVRVVLVDLDLHQPAAGLMLSHEHGPGIVDVLLGDSDLDSAMQCSNQVPVRVINAGSILNLRPGMIESTHLADLVRRLAIDYDLVVVDTPPVLSISDPLYISGLADATIMVVAWRSTPQAHVDEAVRALRSAGAPLAGIVLNKVSRGVNDPSRSLYHDRRYVTA